VKRLFNGFFMSLSMFSIIPSPRIWDNKAFNLVIPALPIVGMIIGSLWCGLAYALVYLKIPLLLRAALIFLLPLILSGFIHVDGYMDTSDAIFSRAELAKKRNILKDSYVGAFAVIMLCIYLLLGFTSLYSVLETGINFIIFIFIPVLSRSLAGVTLLIVKPFSTSGFGATFRQNTKVYHTTIVLCFSALSGLCTYWFGGITMVYALIALVLGGIVASIYVVKQFDGISGDLCGFIIVVSELSALIALATFSS